MAWKHLPGLACWIILQACTFCREGPNADMSRSQRGGGRRLSQRRVLLHNRCLLLYCGIQNIFLATQPKFPTLKAICLPSFPQRLCTSQSLIQQSTSAQMVGSNHSMKSFPSLRWVRRALKKGTCLLLQWRDVIW